MAHISKIYDSIDLANPEKPRQRKLLSKEGDLMIALNHYAPGARNEFHYHKGTSQSLTKTQILRSITSAKACAC